MIFTFRAFEFSRSNDVLQSGNGVSLLPSGERLPGKGVSDLPDGVSPSPSGDSLLANGVSDLPWGDLDLGKGERFSP
jgi:hypothetical protein